MVKKVSQSTEQAQWQRKRVQAHKQHVKSLDRRRTMASLLWYLPALASLTLLQSSAITQPCEENYDWHVMEFLRWMERMNQPPQEDNEQLDQTLSKFFVDMYQEDAMPSYGEKVLAGLGHRLPYQVGTLSSKFPGASRSLKGWRRLKPARTRPPLPFDALLLIAAALAAFHKVSMGIAVLLGFFCYLRPRELTDLLASQLLEPTGGPTTSAAATAFTTWSILLHSFEGLKASKTGHFDENLPLDSEWLSRWIGPFLAALKCGRECCKFLGSFTHEELLATHVSVMAQLGLSALVNSLYGLRHGGASHDTLHAFRPALEVKLRGRWASDKSLLRYRKASLAQREANKLSQAQRSAARKIAEMPEHYFNNLDETRALLQPLFR